MSESDSSYTPSECEEAESDMEIEDAVSEDEEEEESDDVDEEGEDEIDLGSIKTALESRKSKKAAEILAFCSEEKEAIDIIKSAITNRIEALGLDKKTPKALIKDAMDAWSHIYEVISDHVEDINNKIKKD
jgi:thioredoxin-like negative regulator of GroEL